MNSPTSLFVEYSRPFVVNYNVKPSATTPFYSTVCAAGADIYATADGIVEAGKRAMIPTGISMSIPDGYYCEIMPRSGLALKYGIIVLAGVIDSDYVQEIKVILYNSGDIDYMYCKGDRIAQFVFKKYERAEFKLVDNLLQTDRGAGFGSSGR